MAKSAPAKKKTGECPFTSRYFYLLIEVPVASVRSRAAKRASSPSIDTDKSLKTIKPPVDEKKPAVLAIHQGAGVTKKSKHGRKTVLSAKAKRRQEGAMDKAEAVMDKKFTRVEKSKDRARTIQSRSKAWEDQNRKMLAQKELDAATALEQENWESDDDENEQEIAAVSNDAGDVQMDAPVATPAVLASATLAVVAAEEGSDEEL